MLGYHISLEDIEQNKIIENVKSFQIFNSNNKLHSPLIYLDDLKNFLNDNMTKKEIEEYCDNSKKKFLSNIIMLSNFIKSYKVKSLIIHSGYLTKPFSIKNEVIEKSNNDIKFNIVYCKVIEKLSNIKNIYYLLHLPQTDKYSFDKSTLNIISTYNKYIILETENNIKFYRSYLSNYIGDKINNLSNNKIIINCLKHLHNTYGWNICLDTAHIYGAGFNFNINNKLEENFKSIIKCIHLNGNEYNIGSNKDKHIPISEDNIYIIKFIHENALINIPIILERNRESNEEINNEILFINNELYK